MGTLVRFASSAAVGLVTALALFVLMQQLITQQSGQAQRTQSGGLIDFVRVRRDTPVKPKKRELPKRPDLSPQAPPPSAKLTPVASSAPVAVASAPLLSTGATGSATQVALRGLTRPSAGTPNRDGAAIPLVRIEPNYPIRARQQRVEGWVRVRFDITPAGRVENPVVIGAEPAGVFERATLQAFRRWKYRPRVVDGKALPQRNQVTRIVFALD